MQGNGTDAVELHCIRAISLHPWSGAVDVRVLIGLSTIARSGRLLVLLCTRGFDGSNVTTMFADASSTNRSGRLVMRIKKAFIGVGAAALLLGGLAIPSAHAGSSLCPASRVCIYSDNNYVGLLGYRKAGLGVMNVSGGANDRMSSYENKTSTNARWYHDASAKGRCVNMLAHKQDNDINTIDDNTLTSWATNGSC
ncbi:peptidase inhibitor family I36 protein [Acidipropionibacterium jensenii]